MRAYSLKKAKEMVRLYNVSRDSKQVATQLNLPAADVRAVMVWLENNDPLNSKPGAQADKYYCLALPTAKLWAKWLYENGIGAKTAAACVNWPYERLLQSCGGKTQWLLVGTKRKRYLRKPESLEREPGDPTPEEILEQAAALRRGASDVPARVEVKAYVYDGRTVSFEGAS